MNKDEELAQKWIENIGFQSIVYEPDGNVPPDFLVDNKIAVEVRRLNQNYVNKDGKSKGLEDESIPLWHKFKSLLESFGLPDNGKSWFIGIDYERPIPSWKKLKPEIEKVLETLKITQPNRPITYRLLERFELDIIPASKPLKTMFFAGASSDGNSGGWVLSELEKNLKLILPEKYKKIEKHKSKYNEWWLVLPNYIHYGMDECDVEQFNTHIKFQHDWDKVIMVNPLETSNWMDF